MCYLMNCNICLPIQDKVIIWSQADLICRNKYRIVFFSQLTFNEPEDQLIITRALHSFKKGPGI